MISNKMIDKKKLFETIMSKAGEYYQNLKIAKNPYLAPELIPDTIPSDQIKAIAITIVEELVDIIEDKFEKI